MIYHHVISYYFIFNLKSLNCLIIHIKYVNIYIYKIDIYKFIDLLNKQRLE